jgi:molybdopterin synthase catalytic subunit
LVRGRTLINHTPESAHPIHQGLNVYPGPDGPIVETVTLEYEVYLPMARQKMFQIANEIRSRWPSVYGIALIQRIGLLTPTQLSVCVACSAPHRDTGVFEAARYGIDRLKEIVPIWKKEIGRDGEAWVEGDYLPSQGD